MVSLLIFIPEKFIFAYMKFLPDRDGNCQNMIIDINISIKSNNILKQNVKVYFLYNLEIRVFIVIQRNSNLKYNVLVVTLIQTGPQSNAR